MSQLKKDLAWLRKDDGLNAGRMARCEVLPDLECVRRRLDLSERDDRFAREIEAVAFLRSEILLLRSDAKGEVLQREYAIGLERSPKDLGGRQLDLAVERSVDHPPLETIRKHGAEMLRILHARVVELERRARNEPENRSPLLLRNASPYEYLTIDAVYRFTDSRVPNEFYGSQVIQAKVDGCSALYARDLYTGGTSGIHREIIEGCEDDSAFEPRLTATGLLVSRVRFPPLAEGDVHRIVTKTVVDDRVSVPQPFACITPDVYAEAVRLTTEFPRGDAPQFVQRFVSWGYEVPIPLEHIPLVDIPVENGVAEVRFDKVGPGFSVGMRWDW